MFLRTLSAGLIVMLTACAPGTAILDKFEAVPSAPIADAPEPQPSASASSKVVAQGKYMVELLGCGGCHTEGALMGAPVSGLSLAGSHTGIAHSNPLETDTPGVVFPSNLTPDPDTGIGRKTDLELKAAISGRVGRHTVRRLRVMPVIAYSKVRDEDIDAVIAYLRSVPPVRNAIPRNVPAGKRTAEKYVHFGIYRSRER